MSVFDQKTIRTAARWLGSAQGRSGRRAARQSQNGGHAGKANKNNNRGNLNWIVGVHPSVFEYMSRLSKAQGGREGNRAGEMKKIDRVTSVTHDT